MAHPLDWLTSFGIMVRYIRIVLLAGLLRIRFCALICFGPESMWGMELVSFWRWI